MIRKQTTKPETAESRKANGLLNPASNEQAAAKVGIFGSTGSSKTTTGGLVTIGLSLTHCEGRPIAMMDTECASDFLLPIFCAEGVPLLTLKSKAFTDMLSALAEAERMRCATLIIDSVTHPWAELIDSYCRRKGISKPEFQHWKEIKQPWSEWTGATLSVVESVFGTRSWEAVQQQSLERLEKGPRALREVETAQKGAQLSEEIDVPDLVRECLAKITQQCHSSV